MSFKVSSRAVVESCVLPVLLYECENLVLTEQLISCLETFLSELPKSYQGGPPTLQPANVVMDWTTVVQKMSFHHGFVCSERERECG